MAGMGEGGVDSIHELHTQIRYRVVENQYVYISMYRQITVHLDIARLLLPGQDGLGRGPRSAVTLSMAFNPVQEVVGLGSRRLAF